MSHSIARRATLLLGAVAAAATSAVLLAPGGARASGTPACTGSQLVATIAPARGGASAGTFYYTLTFTDLGATCALRGYPGISAVGLTGRQLGRSAVRETGSEKTVILHSPTTHSASTATAAVGFVDTGDFGRSCDQHLAAGLRVYPPNSTVAKAVPIVFDACTRGSDAFLKVMPVR